MVQYYNPVQMPAQQAQYPVYMNPSGQWQQNPGYSPVPQQMVQPNPPQMNAAQQPSMSQMNPPQQQPQQVPPLVGRMVDPTDQLRASDVPADGTPAYFPVNDGSAILVKIQLNNGLIQTIKYVPEPQQSQQTQETAQDPAIQDKLMEKLDKLESMQSQIMDYLTK